MAKLQFTCFFVLSIMTVQTDAIETVNVVDLCGQTIGGDGMIVQSHQESRRYYFVRMGTDCYVTLQAATPHDKVQFQFRYFLVYSLLRVSPFSPVPFAPESVKGPTQFGLTRIDQRMEPTPDEAQEDPCHAGSYIQFYDGQDKTAPTIGPPLCGKSLPRPILSTGNYLTLRLVTRGTQPRVDFVGDFTSFRLGLNQSECSSESYFTCQNGKCIPMSLVCNDNKEIDNCADGSDLQDYPGCTSSLTTASIYLTSSSTSNVATIRTLTLGKMTGPNLIPDVDSVTDAPPYVSLLTLYVVLGVLVGSVIVCWCCCSRGWFLSRVNVCRFLPYCNSCCATCQLCSRNCLQNKEHRLTKVTPQQAPMPGASSTTTTTSTGMAGLIL